MSCGGEILRQNSRFKSHFLIPAQKTARIILMDDALDCLMSFPDFIYAFQVQFYFNEFLCKCADVFNKLLSSPHSPRETVVVPTETTEGWYRRLPSDSIRKRIATTMMTMIIPRLYQK